MTEWILNLLNGAWTTLQTMYAEMGYLFLTILVVLLATLTWWLMNWTPQSGKPPAKTSATGFAALEPGSKGDKTIAAYIAALPELEDDSVYYDGAPF